MQAIGYHIDKITRNIFRKKGFATAKIITEWNIITGDEMISRNTIPIKIVYPQGKTTNGTLYVEVKSGLALEFQAREQEIIEKISGYFGFRAIEKIRIIQN